jgi:hypothetical protein
MTGQSDSPKMRSSYSVHSNIVNTANFRWLIHTEFHQFVSHKNTIHHFYPKNRRIYITFNLSGKVVAIARDVLWKNLNLNGHQTDLTDIPTKLMSRKDERICNGARRETRVIDSTRDQVSAQRGITSCNRFVSHVADAVCSKYFPVVNSNHSQNEDQQPLCGTTLLRPHCNSKKEHDRACT